MRPNLLLRYLLLLGFLLRQGTAWAQQPAYLDNSTTPGPAPGTGTGLTGEYYAGYNGTLVTGGNVAFYTKSPDLRRNDAQLNFSGSNLSVPVPPAGNTGTAPTAFSARFRGSIYLTAGTYSFGLQADDLAYLWVGPSAATPSPVTSGAGGPLLTASNASVATTAANSFVAGTSGFYDIQILYTQNGGNSRLELRKASGSGVAFASQTVVAQTELYPGPAAANAAPTASNMSNVVLPRTAAPAAVALSPGLSGTDSDGSIVFYNILSLPSATLGTLRLSGVAVVAGQAIPAAQIGNLTFTPVANATGTSSFKYNVTDDKGRTSAASAYTALRSADGATYTLSVQTPPTAVADAAATGVNTPVTFSLSGNDTFVTPAASLNTASIDLVPAGTATASYTITDDQGLTSNTVAITVTVSASCQPSFLDNASTGNGLTGEYYASYAGVFTNSSTFNRLPTLRRTDAQLTFNAANLNVPVPPASNTAAAPNTFSGRFRGSISLAAATTYTFSLLADDVAYLWLGPSALTPTPDFTAGANGPLLSVTTAGSTVTASFTTTTAGLYDIQILYSQNNGNSRLELRKGIGSGLPYASLTPITQAELCPGPASANAAPVAVNGTNTAIIPQNAAATTLAPGPGATDSDGSIAFYNIITLPANGTLRLSGVAVTVGQALTPAQAAALTFQPTAGFTGSTSFTFNATDDLGRLSAASAYTSLAGASGATYTINVQTAPVAVADVVSTPLNTPVTFSLTGNDSFTAPATSLNTATLDLIPGGSIDNTVVTAGGTFTTVGAPAGSVTFTPASGFAGTTAASYTVQDSQGLTSNTVAITVTVNAVCQPSYLDNSTSTNGLTAEYFASNLLQNAGLGTADQRIAQFNRVAGLRRTDATVNFPASGSFGGIVPPAGGTNANEDNYSARYRGSIYLQAGDYTFQIVADDAAYLWVGPTALSPAPTSATALIAQPNYAGNAPQRANFTAATSGLYDLQLVFSEGGGGNNITLSYAPGLSQTTGFSIVPNSVLCAGPAGTNAAPVASNGTNAGIQSSAAATTLSPGLSGTDADGSIAYFQVITLPTNGTLRLAGVALVTGQTLSAAQAATLTYTPNGTFTGNDTFTFNVIDDQGRLSGATAYAGTLTPSPAGATYTIPVLNSPPVVANTTNVAVSNTSPAAALNPGVSATDLDGSVASYSVTGPASSGTLFYSGVPVTGTVSIPAANINQLTYQPAAGFVGNATFTFTATDNSALTSGTATYTIPVYSPADLATTLRAVTGPGGTQIFTSPQGALTFFEASTTNSGPGPATNTVVSIQLPAGLTGVSLSASGTYNTATGLATFPATTINAGQTVSYNIAFTMLGTTVNASATATTSIADPNSANNVGTAFVNPTQVADVFVAINGPSRVLTNQPVLYTVVPTNLGPSPATGITMGAQLPTGLSNVVVSNGGVYNASTGLVTWGTIGTLANGASVNYTVRFNAPSTAGPLLAPSASFSAAVGATSTTADGDPVAANNNGTNGAAQITTQVVTQAATLLCIAPSSTDVSLSDGNFNTYYPGLGTVSAGSTSLTVGAASTRGSSTPRANGDLALIIQMQGADLSNTNSSAYGDGIGGDVVGSGNLLNTSFTAGTYEYAIVSSYNAGTGVVTFTQALGYGYSNADATASSGQRRYQVIRVPLYRDVTLLNNISAPRWDGSTGGVLAMDANGTLNLNGFKIDMSGRGFRGGAGQQLGGAGGVANTDYRHSVTLNTSANKGEGTAGTPRFLYDDDYFQAYKAGGAGNPTSPVMDTQVASTFTLPSTGTVTRPALLPGTLTDGYPSGDRARGAPGNGGGGGTDGRPSANDENTGGGGGSNAGRGGVGGNAWNSNFASGGFGGADFTQATASRIIMGGGGGAGTTNNGTVAGGYPANTGVPGNGFASSGAAGGGIVIIRANNVGAGAAGTGTIDVSGASMPFVASNDASGGGGAAGSLVLLCNASNANANSTVLSNITVLAKGGDGGSNTGGGSPHGPGGGGAGGVSFTSSVVSASSNFAAGVNGTTFGFQQYGSGTGYAALGQAQAGITRADVPNIISACPADVVTTISSNVSSQTPGQPVILTVSSVNNGPGTAFGVVQTVTLAPALPIASVQINGQSASSIAGNVATYPDGTTYNQSTGIVTFPSVATLASGSTENNTITLTMPNQNLNGISASSSTNDLDPRTANNDGSLPPARVTITAINAVAGRVFDDVNYGGGLGRDFSTANTSAVASGFASGAIGSPNTRVELYTSTGTFYGATTTGADGTYGFASVPVGNYTVRVVNSTVRSARDNAASGVVPVQTFRTNNGSADPNRVGGENPAGVDGAANTGTGSVTLNFTGLNTSGGDNTAFVDQVELIDVVTGNVIPVGGPANVGFETPNLGTGNSAYQYNPSGGSWNFTGSTGIAAFGSAFDPPAVPQGNQVAFVQQFGSFNQTFSLPVGTYRVRFRIAQRNCCSGTNDQTVSVRIGANTAANEIGVVQPPNNSAFGTYTTGTFTVAGFPLSSITAQSQSNVTVGGSAVSGVDFGYNFSTIVNTNDAGQGSLRQFITNANALPNGLLDQDASSVAGGSNPAQGIETSIFMIPNGTTRDGILASVPSQLNGSGVAVIMPASALPALTATNTSIDGTTQTVNIGNTNNATLGAGGTVGSASTSLSQLNGPEVQIVGTPGLAGTDVGLSLENTGLTVRGLSIYGFGNTGGGSTGNPSGANIRVTSAAISGTVISGNVIGSGATAFADPGSASSRSTGNGILLTGFPVGATVSAQITNNLIGFNGASGIENLASATPTSVNIQGNEIRGNALLATSADGVRMGTAGGTVQGNLIIANVGSGVDLAGTNGAVTVSGNTIDGNGTGGAETAGVRAFGQGNTVSTNVIRNNAGDGLLVRPGTNVTNVAGNTVASQNSIYNNGQLGINLLNTGDNESTGAASGGGTRVTLNDAGDNDGRSDNASPVGGNGLFNYPVFTSATIVGTNLVLQGFARPGTRIELFNTALTSPAASADASGFGEGPLYLGQVTEGGAAGGGNLVADTNAGTGSYSGTINGVNQGADNTNRFTFTIPLASVPGVSVGSVLTATGTLAAIGTSEFSANVPVVAPVAITGTIFEDRNYGGGAGRDFATIGSTGRVGRLGGTSSGTVTAAATVELYDSFGGLVATTTTSTANDATLGTYTFNVPPGSYTVRVVNSTVRSTRTGSAAGQLPVQTYVYGDVNRVGGEAPEKADAAANATSANISTLTTATNTPQSLAPITVGTGGLTGVDFGFNFSTIVNTSNTGQGSLRQFITNSNALANSTLADNTNLSQVGQLAGREVSIFMVPNGATTGAPAGLRNGLVSGLTGGRVLIQPTTALPAITGGNAARTRIDGRTQTTYVGDSNSGQLGTGGTVGTGSTTLNQVNRPEVEISVPNTFANALDFEADSVGLVGIAVHGGGTGTAGAVGTVVVGATATVRNLQVRGALIGTTALSLADPNAALPGSYGAGPGLLIRGTNSGGDVQGSIIAYNGDAGLEHSGTGTLLVRGNEFTQNGYRSTTGDNIAVGSYATAGAATIQNNLISNSNSAGIQFTIGSLGVNTVSGNTITGSGSGGLTGFTSTLEGSGIFYRSTTGAQTGTNADVISTNIITQSQGSGIVINVGQSRIRLTQNSTYTNGTAGNTATGGNLGIDLTPTGYFVGAAGNGGADNGNGDGVTANDGALTAGQASGGIDYPIFTSALLNSGSSVTVSGYVGNAAGQAAFAGATIDVYLADDSPANNGGPVSTLNTASVAHGEGRTYVGSLTADASGNFSGTLTAPAGTFSTASLLTATAYLATQGTSEFGPNVAVLPADVTTLITGPNALGAGQPSGTFTASFTNNGPGQASNVTHVVALPAGSSLTTAQQSALTTAYPGTTFTNASGPNPVITFPASASLLPGASAVFQFAFTSPTTLGANSLTSTVTTTSNQGSNTALDAATFNLTVTPVANVAASITPQASPVTAGQTGRFDVSFSNAGPSTAAGVVATVQLPLGLSNVAVEGQAGTVGGGGVITYPNGATYNPNNGVLTYAATTSLASGASVASYFTYTQPTTPSVTAIASVQTSTNQGANGTSNDSQAATILTTAANDLTVSLSGPSTATLGGQSTYTVTTTNVGASTQPAAVTTVNIGPGRLNVFVSGGGSYDSGTGIVTFPATAPVALPSVALTSGQSITRTISFTQPTSGTSVSVVANVTPLAGDPTPANNTATLTTNLTAPASANSANLLVLVSGPASASPGGTVTYTVQQANNGPAVATGVATTLSIQPGLSGMQVNGQSPTSTVGGVSSYTDGSSYNANTGIVTFPALATQAQTLGSFVTNTVTFTAPATGTLTADRKSVV